jgi:hypothetical protein
MVALSSHTHTVMLLHTRVVLVSIVEY